MSTQLSLLLEDRPVAPAPPRSHFVRSHMRVEEAEAGEAQAKHQEAELLRWFQAQPAGARFTPSFVHMAFLCWPVTSVRRALTVMTRKGLLTHWPGDRRPGPHGKPESVWSLSC